MRLAKTKCALDMDRQSFWTQDLDESGTRQRPFDRGPPVLWMLFRHATSAMIIALMDPL